MRHVFDGSAKQINVSAAQKLLVARPVGGRHVRGSPAVLQFSHVYPGGEKFAKVNDFDNLISPREVYLDFLRDR